VTDMREHIDRRGDSSLEKRHKVKRRRVPREGKRETGLGSERERRRGFDVG